jgi:hypothetical protein
VFAVKTEEGMTAIVAGDEGAFEEESLIVYGHQDDKRDLSHYLWNTSMFAWTS